VWWNAVSGFSTNLVKAVPHRHVVFGILKILQRYFLCDRKLLSGLSKRQFGLGTFPLVAMVPQRAAKRQIAPHQLQIGCANASLQQPHQRLARTQQGHGQILPDDD
jgi:hypothetical protein